MLNFYKYHGAGNDFLMINNLKGDISLSPEKIKEMCDRHFGIGADGVILLEKSNKVDLSRPNEVQADCFMNYNNSDGSIGEMCGNGVRCTAKFYLEQTNSDISSKVLPYCLKIDTRAGVKEIKCNVDGSYSVDMGEPIFSHPDIPRETIKIEGYDFDSVNTGVPHTVTFVKDLDEIDIKTIGPKIEIDSHFLKKTNVEFVEKTSDDYYKVKVWERGCGETLACGTGACAVYSIIEKQIAEGKAFRNNEITLEFPGGKLFLSKNEKGHVILRGPAMFVFDGKFDNK
jgi:diaminopimelate epimerase